MSRVARRIGRFVSEGSWETRLARPVEDVWSWASDVERLDAVTPPWFTLAPLSPPPLDLAEGVEIEYRFRWRFLVGRWRSRIVDWQPPTFFAYEQARGPFRRFRHEHLFEVSEGGTRMIDRVLYRAWGGSLVDRSLVAPDLDRIFAFRRLALERLARRDRPVDRGGWAEAQSEAVSAKRIP